MKKFIFLAILLNCIVTNAQSVIPVDGKLLESIQRLDEGQLKALVGSNDLVMLADGIRPAVQQMPVNFARIRDSDSPIVNSPGKPLGCGNCIYGGELQIWITESGREKLLQSVK